MNLEGRVMVLSLPLEGLWKDLTNLEGFLIEGSLEKVNWIEVQYSIDFRMKTSRRHRP